MQITTFHTYKTLALEKILWNLLKKCQKIICRILGTIMLYIIFFFNFRPFWTCQKYHKSQILRIYAWKVYALLFHSSVSLVHILVHLYLILVDKWGWIFFVYIDFQKSKRFTDIILPSSLFFQMDFKKVPITQQFLSEV